jgi:hypothetical protein
MSGVSRALFSISGVLWLVIGVLAGVLVDRGVGPPMVFISERTDTALFGGPPEEILDSVPELRTFRLIVVRGALAGFLVASGLLTAAVAWFGLREGQTWALGLLTVVGVAVLPYWWMALVPYREAGISLTLGDIPPFMWVPAILMPVAGALGWIGYLRT